MLGLRQYDDSSRLVIATKHAHQVNDSRFVAAMSVSYLSKVTPDFLISSIDPNYKDSNNSTIAVPIFTRNFDIGAPTKRVLWGILIVHCSVPPIGQSEITTLKLVASEIGIAIGTAQLLTKLQTEASTP